MSRELPSDPNLVTLQWGWHAHSLVVWEDANEARPWVLRWRVELNPRDVNEAWVHQEEFTYVWDALARAAVITSSIKNDERLIQQDLASVPDRLAFERLVNALVVGSTVVRRGW